MSQYTDFDLDIRQSSGALIDGDSTINQSQSIICTATQSACSCLDSCSGNCTMECTLVGNCPTVASCSDCHSYCGSACR